jgi:hypothetical protein
VKEETILGPNCSRAAHSLSLCLIFIIIAAFLAAIGAAQADNGKVKNKPAITAMGSGRRALLFRAPTEILTGIATGSVREDARFTSAKSLKQIRLALP